MKHIDVDHVLKMALALPPRESAILDVCYGISNDPHKLREAARIFRVTNTRMHQMRERAVRSLVSAMNDEDVTPEIIEQSLIAAATRRRFAKMFTEDKKL